MKPLVEVMVDTGWQMENMQGEAEECVLDKACPSYVVIIGLHKGSKAMNDSNMYWTSMSPSCG